MAGDLHDHVGDAAFERDGQERLEFGGLGGGALGADDLVGDAGLDGADDAGGAPGAGEAGLDEVGRGGLAVGAGDADEVEVPGRVAPDAGGDAAGELSGLVGDQDRQASGDELGASGVGEDAHRAAVGGLLGELGAVAPGAGQRREQVAGFDERGREAHAGDGELGVLGCGNQVGEVGDPVGPGVLGPRKG